MTLGFFAFTRLQVDLNVVAAFLTIVGYSLNDTVVIYDRIREMMRKYKKMHTDDMIDQAVNSTLSRSVITHVTTTLALVGLAVFGGEVIRGFTIAMLFGVMVGTYSSVFIAAPILIYLGVRTDGRTAPEPEKAEKRPGKTPAPRAASV
jgi:preprotein translocase SecF subunit